MLSRSSGHWRSTGWRAYALGLSAIAVALAVTAALTPYLDEDVLYTPLIGTVVIVSVFCGLGPALLGVAVGWLIVLLAFIEPEWSLRGDRNEDLVRWAIGLAVSLVLIWTSWVVQRLGERETRRARDAEETTAIAQALNELSGALASAATPPEVAGALLARVPALLGSAGGSFGLVVGNELAVVDPAGGPRPVLRPGTRLPLSTRAPITTAARTGEIAYAMTREELARDYPDSLRLAPSIASALAVPLRTDGRVVGSIGFPFATAHAIDDDVLSLARIAAQLGAQSLGRALAYEQERALRAGLDRIARLAPSVADKPAETVAQAICVEAREMFEADVAQLWKVGEGRPEVIWREPPSPTTPPGHVAEARDYPGMQRALDRLDTIFVPDARTTVSGEALQRIIEEGVRSLLRVPIVIAGRAEMLLALRWREIIPEPTPQTLALARRFADHAGLVIEHEERRRAQTTEQTARARAERLAGDLAQLHAIASSLGAASEVREVAGLVAERVLALSGAETAAVHDVTAGGDLHLLASVASDAALARRGDTARPVRRVDPGTVPSSPTWEDEGPHPSGVLPLLVEGRVVGVLVVEFAPGRVPDEGTRRLVETIAGHAAPPLERARLHELEHSARIRAELSARRTRRLQALTAAFAGALTPAEVAATFLDETVEAVGAAAAALAVLDVERGELHAVSSRNFPGELLGPEGTLPVSAGGPAPAAVRLQEPSYHDDLGALVAAHPLLAEALEDVDLRSFAFLPLTAGAAPLGVVALAWQDPRRLDADERAFLEAVVAQCGLALDRAQRYEGERVVAETLQRSVLPETLPSMEGVRVSAVYLPGSTAVDVGGDWFDTLTLPDGRLGFVVGDVVGKGVQAASTMAQLRNGMRALTLDTSSPAATIMKLNLLLENYIDVPFATLVYVALDPATHAVTLASAGHPPPLVVGPDGRTSFLESSGGLPLGVDVATEYTDTTTVLEPGSIVVLYTDGLVERRGSSIDDGLDDLARAAERAPRTPEGFVDALVRDILGAGERFDDVAVLAVFVDPTLLAPLDLAIPAEPQSLPYLRTELERWLAGAAVPDVDARDILLATWEAGANAIEHAEAGSGALVRVEVTLSGDRVRIRVADTGRWKEPREREDRGLGLRLIESLMASVDVERGANGTNVVMERPLTRGPALGHAAHPAEH